MNCSDVACECDFLKGLSCQGVDGAKECGWVLFSNILIHSFKFNISI